ncbi:hypothetical protein [Nocardioides terrisoli]|uniref:hypothetical protein n=1 Tax=Nocardioides terrisoli TaxID=3388267 RepID=UPI00287BB95E|nr:hypothetical protein [Nocardioides marmorisolisilvae]
MTRRGPETERLVEWGWCALLVVAALGPALWRAGYVLRSDMVFVPHQPWKGTWLGLDGTVGRAVPADAIVSVLTHLVSGDVVQKLVLGGSLLLAGLAVRALVADCCLAGRLAATTLYVWNPWVEERLAIGQWGTVLGYALLPWVVVAARGLRRDRPGRGVPLLVLALAGCSACTPSAGLLAGATALAVVVTGRNGRATRAGVVVLTTLVVSLPWVLPSLLGGGLRAASGGQFQVFGARAESGLGTAASVFSLGGIWKAAAVPPERTSSAIVLLSLVVTCVAIAGAARWWSVTRDRTCLGLALLAAVSVVLALAAAVPGVAAALDSASVSVPALGFVRDSQRFLAPLALLLAVGTAWSVDWLWRRARVDGARILAGALVPLPALLLPTMAWGLHGDFRPVQYPAEWGTVARQLADRPQPDRATVVLPWHGSYRGFAWNGHHAVLDPADRFFPGPVLVDDRLYVGSHVVGSERALLGRVGDALAAPDPARRLRALGVRRILVEKGNGQPASAVPTGRIVHDGPQLRLVDLGTAASLPRSGPPTLPVLAVDAGWAVLVPACAALLVASRRGVSVRQRARPR